MAYRGIFFDIGWTLMRPRRSWFLTDLFFEMTEGKELDPSVLQTALDASIPILNQHHRMDTYQEEEAQFQRFYQALLANLPSLCLESQAAAMLAHDKVYNYSNYIFFEDALPVLATLSSEYRLGIISDTWPSATGFLKDVGLYPLFDSITFSCNLGVFKPDPKLYQHALNSMDLPASSTLFVDDNPACLAGAEKAGILPVQICCNPDAPPPEYSLHISSLSQLPKLLSQLS